MEYYGNRLAKDQVDAIVDYFMKERYGSEERQATLDDIHFALRFYLKRMTGEPHIYVHQNDQGEWMWDIVEEGFDDEAYYDHQN